MLFFWSLYRLSFFNLRLLLTPLIVTLFFIYVVFRDITNYSFIILNWFYLGINIFIIKPQKRSLLWIILKSFFYILQNQQEQFINITTPVWQWTKSMYHNGSDDKLSGKTLQLPSFKQPRVCTMQNVYHKTLITYCQIHCEILIHGPIKYL